jgi:hypothetical protein
MRNQEPTIGLLIDASRVVWLVDVVLSRVVEAEGSVPRMSAKEVPDDV